VTPPSSRTDILHCHEVGVLVGGTVRNQCDHASKTEPTRESVADLIAEVGKFVALFVT
jgi:hypothetical protein